MLLKLTGSPHFYQHIRSQFQYKLWVKKGPLSYLTLSPTFEPEAGWMPSQWMPFPGC